MTRRNAFRQCDVERAIRAAKATGAGRVVVHPDGSLAIELERAPDTAPSYPSGRLTRADDIVL